jgi:hypothetical protein
MVFFTAIKGERENHREHNPAFSQMWASEKAGIFYVRWGMWKTGCGICDVGCKAEEGSLVAHRRSRIIHQKISIGVGKNIDRI